MASLRRLATEAVLTAHPERVSSQPENPYASLIPDQQIAIIPEYTLESGVTIRNAPLAYSTRGRLSPDADNAMVICHALTGSADVSDWWGPLLGGSGRAFDISRFFVVCINSLGSPYGSVSPVTNKDGDPSQGRYGPEFPLTTIRDDVGMFRLLLDDLGVKRIAAVIGGSMGGMLVLEFAYFGKTTSAQSSRLRHQQDIALGASAGVRHSGRAYTAIPDTMTDTIRLRTLRLLAWRRHACPPC